MTLDDDSAPANTTDVLELFKQMWVRWQKVAGGILYVQNTILMGVAYFVGLGPVALGFRAAGKALVDRAPADPKAASYWRKRSGKPQTMDEANRMF